MRIADVKVHVLEAPLSEPFAWSFNATSVRAACLVEITCEDGTVGWGECFGPAALNAAVVNAFRPHLVGADPLASDRLWMQLYSHFRDQGQRGLVVTALSGVDVALWDIKGKHFGEAVGPNIGLMLDANHGYDVTEAIALGRKVADCDIGWLEEPVVPEDLEGYAEVRRSQPI